MNWSLRATRRHQTSSFADGDIQSQIWFTDSFTYTWLKLQKGNFKRDTYWVPECWSFWLWLIHWLPINAFTRSPAYSSLHWQFILWNSLFTSQSHSQNTMNDLQWLARERERERGGNGRERERETDRQTDRQTDWERWAFSNGRLFTHIMMVSNTAEKQNIINVQLFITNKKEKKSKTKHFTMKV